MTALTKFVLALEATLGGIEATVLAATGDPARSDAQAAIAVVLGCAAGTLGIAYAAGAAFNAGRGPEEEVAAPLGILPWEEPAPDRDAAVIESYDTMRTRPATVAPGPAWPQSAAVTQWDMSPVEDTAEIPPVPGADPWRPPPSETAAATVPKAPVEQHADLYAHPGGEWPAEVAAQRAWLDDWFAPATARQAGDSA